MKYFSHEYIKTNNIFSIDNKLYLINKKEALH